MSIVLSEISEAASNCEADNQAAVMRDLNARLSHVEARITDGLALVRELNRLDETSDLMKL